MGDISFGNRKSPATSLGFYQAAFSWYRRENLPSESSDLESTFSRSRLLQFAMNCVALESWVVLFLFEPFWVSLSVFSRRVTRRRLSLFAGLGALNSNDSNFALFSHVALPLKIRSRTVKENERK